jgi:hypothetical protein
MLASSRMKDFWTASGKPFGYLTGKNLRTLDGWHIGRLVGTEIFAPDGSYLGEVAQGHYLVIDLSKREKTRTAIQGRCAEAGFNGIGRHCPLDSGRRI